MSSWTYQDWSLPYGRARGAPHDPETARARYDAGDTICLTVGDDPTRPQQVLHAHRRGHLIRVTWLDRLLRNELTYLFHTRTDRGGHPDRLLLERVHLASYADDRPPPLHVSSHDHTSWFRPDGHWNAARHTRGSGQHQTTGGKLAPDQQQSETVPAFGQWDALLIRER